MQQSPNMKEGRRRRTTKIGEFLSIKAKRGNEATKFEFLI